MSATGLAGLAGCSGNGGGDGGDGGDGGGGGGDGGSGGGNETPTETSGGGSDGGDGGSGGGESATLWAWNDPGLQPTREDQASEFAQMYDAVSEAQWQTFPFADYLSKVTNAIPAGNAPDAMALSVLWVPRLIDQGVVVNLEENGWDGFNPDDWVGAGRHNSSYNGTMSAIPWYVDCRFLGINRDHFDQAGIDVPDPTYRPTWDEFAQWNSTLASELDVSAGFSMPAGEGFDAFVLSNGGNYINDDATEAIINNQNAVEAAEFLQPKVVDDETMIARPTGATDTGIDDFTTQNASMYYAGLWQVPRLQDSDINWQFLPFPSGPELDNMSHTWSAGVFYTVPSRGGANQEIGLDFLQYIASEDQQAKVTDQVGGFPGLKSAYDTDTFQQVVDNEPRFQTAVQEIENTVGFPSHPEVATMWNAVHTQAEALWQGDDIQSTLDSAAQQINDVL
ncbi:MAG: extracellular solute-binding protein [Haloarculaceae archaeon]